MMRRHRSIVVFLLVMLSTAVHALAQSTYEPPPAPPRKTPTPVPTALGGVQRPQALSFGSDGESGTYTYDGSGNITGIGSDTFLYDAEGRLVTAVVRGVTGSYTYDAFGNRKTATGETNCYGQTVCVTPLTVSSSTNRLLTTTNGSTANVGYDAAGNITSASGGNYTYDGTGMMIEATVGSDDRQFVYTADDERIAVRQGASWTWTVRGMDNKVLCEFTSVEPNNSTGFPTASGQWKKDYIWRDGQLLASVLPTTEGTISPRTTYHYHLDHLGTPRLITDGNHILVGKHAYYAFGAEMGLTPKESATEKMKFTGHERDIVAGDGNSVDYMHARYYNPNVGRLLSVDPVLEAEKALKEPQRWNRYAYVLNNPMNHSDPTGKVVEIDASADVRRLKALLAQTMRRPTGRADVMAVINDPNHKLRVTSGMLTAPAQTQMNMQTRGSASVTFGRTVPNGTVQLQPNGTGQFIVSGSTMTIDTNAVSRHHSDRSGVTTTAHEFDHVNDLRAGGVAQMLAGDVPSSATGPAEQHGQGVAAERPDITVAQAQQLVDQLIPVVRP